MSYELQKQLAIKDALLADWEHKNRRLRETIDATERAKGEAVEQLTVKEATYEAKIKSLNEELDYIQRNTREVDEKRREVESLEKAFRKTYQKTILDLREKVATQDTVIEDLTSDLLRANRDIGKLEAKLEKRELKDKVVNRLDKVLKTFE